jgi:histidine ammonia-lyase
MMPVLLEHPADLDRDLIIGLARGTSQVALAPALVAEMAANRQAVLADLAGDQPVYGVNTGMGAMAGVRLDAEAQQRHQDTLMSGRAVGSAPWLRRDEARAVLAVRLRTLLHPAAGASPALCQHVIDLLNADVIPAIPARGSGAAGEIIPLAHAGAALLGTGQVLDRHGNAADAGPALAAAGLRPRSFGAKEGVAFLEGVPGLTALAILASSAVRQLVPQILVVTAAAHSLVRANHDPLHPALPDARISTALLKLIGNDPAAASQASQGSASPQALLASASSQAAPGSASPEPAPSQALPEPAPSQALPGPTPSQASPGPASSQALPGPAPSRALQAPVSFRVTVPALAVVIRATEALDAAADRALSEVTDSPAHLDGRFVGTAGFAGTDLAAACGALTTALAHLADVGTARLHRLLDPATTGLPRQLSDKPGVHAGMVSVHKRAVGVTHRLRRFTLPALGGTIETSLGQEDVQSFGFEAAECLSEAIAGLRDVLACELLAIHQAVALGGPLPDPPRDAAPPPLSPEPAAAADLSPDVAAAAALPPEPAEPTDLSPNVATTLGPARAIPAATGLPRGVAAAAGPSPEAETATGLSREVAAALGEVAAILPGGTGDRPFGRDIDRILELLLSGWAAAVPVP